MKISNLFVTACGTVAIAACGGGGGDGVANPAFVGQVGTAVSATLSGTSNGQVIIGFDANNNLIIQMPDGDIATLLPGTGTAVIDSRLGNQQVIIVQSVQGDNIEIVANDNYALIRLDDIDTPLLGYEAYAVIGDETASLPTGTATYDGRFISTAYIGGSTLNVEDGGETGSNFIYGDVDVFADFGANDVDVTLTFDANNILPEFNNGSLSGTNLAISGSQYSGSISGTTSSYQLDGALIGGFYGPNATQTAGTFTADDAAANAEIVGGYGADQTSATP